MPCCYANIDDNFLQPRQHISKKAELKKVLKKFGKAMALVCVSGVGLFVILSVFRGLSSRQRNSSSNLELDKVLTSPETIEEATKFVIEKF